MGRTATAKPLPRTIQVRTSAKLDAKLAALERKTGLSRSDLVRHALWTLPVAGQMDSDQVVDLIETVTGELP